MSTDIKKRLSQTQYNKTIKLFPRMTEKTLKMVKATLVDGETLESVAERHGSTKQFISKKNKSIYDAYILEVEGLPRSWVNICATVPPKVAKAIKKLEQEAKNALLK